MEMNNILVQRTNYSRRIQKSDELSAKQKPLTYLDDTTYIARLCWQNYRTDVVMNVDSAGHCAC
jgi:hypothetical protein